MSQTACGIYRKQKWYNKNIFPLVPILELKKGDNYNTPGFTFRWLFFTIWTLDSAYFEFTIVADTHWGIGIVGIFPYLRWVVAIPCPEKISIWWNKLTSRGNNYF